MHDPIKHDTGYKLTVRRQKLAGTIDFIGFHGVLKFANVPVELYLDREKHFEDSFHPSISPTMRALKKVSTT